MCLFVLVGNYSCGHPRAESHGIPVQFIRECSEAKQFRDCHLTVNDEDIPWLCPNCHWEYVERNLAPLWQQTTVTKCRVLQDVQIFPAEPEYAPSQNAADQMQSTFEAQQKNIVACAASYHWLRDRTLTTFLVENCFCLRRAHHAHRPWTLSLSKDPFTRVRMDADTDVDPEASNYAQLSEDLIEPMSLPSPVGTDPVMTSSRSDPANPALPVQTDQGLTHPDMQIQPVPPPWMDESGADGRENILANLTCIRCHHRDSSVTVGQRLCADCAWLGSISERVRRPRTARMADLEPDLEDPSSENPFALGTTRSIDQGGGNTLMRDLSLLPLGPPMTIPPAHRGALGAFLENRQETETAIHPRLLTREEMLERVWRSDFMVRRRERRARFFGTSPTPRPAISDSTMGGGETQDIEPGVLDIPGTFPDEQAP
jgi:hypothetical protein